MFTSDLFKLRLMQSGTQTTWSSPALSSKERLVELLQDAGPRNGRRSYHQ